MNEAPAMIRLSRVSKTYRYLTSGTSIMNQTCNCLVMPSELRFIDLTT